MAFDANIKIFGERNTATNALAQIVARNSASRCVPSTAEEIDPRMRLYIMACNQLERFLGATGPAYQLREGAIDRVFRIVPDRYAWKHAATRFDGVGAFRGLSVFLTVRNPASWLLSFHKNPYHVEGGRQGSLADFALREIAVVERERLGPVRLRPLDLYEAKLRSYLEFRDQLEKEGIPCRILKFEDIVTDQPGVFDAIRRYLRDPVPFFTPLQMSAKTRSIRSRSKSLEHYRDYYGNERWRAEMGAVYDLVQQQFSAPLAEAFGYRL